MVSDGVGAGVRTCWAQAEAGISIAASAVIFALGLPSASALGMRIKIYPQKLINRKGYYET